MREVIIPICLAPEATFWVLHKNLGSPAQDIQKLEGAQWKTIKRIGECALWKESEKTGGDFCQSEEEALGKSAIFNYLMVSYKDDEATLLSEAQDQARSWAIWFNIKLSPALSRALEQLNFGNTSQSSLFCDFKI